MEEKLIEEQVKFLKKGFSKWQIRDNIFRFVFRAYVPNQSIDNAIHICMHIYSDVICKYNNEVKDV